MNAIFTRYRLYLGGLRRLVCVVKARIWTCSLDLPSRFYYAMKPTYLQEQSLQQTSGGLNTSTSPFSCLVDEVFHLDDVELQFSILNVIWFQRLVFWKMETFGRSVYIYYLIHASAASQHRPSSYPRCADCNHTPIRGYTLLLLAGLQMLVWPFI